jgi:predicted nucleic acid-binding protein
VTGFLLDTNVVSELRKGERADAGVLGWFESVGSDDLYLSVLVVGEIRRGIELIRRRDPSSAQSLEAWLSRLRRQFKERVLPVDDEVAQLWGTLGLERPLPPIDGLLAATALCHDLTLVTRNETDVSRAPIRVLNPFGR